MGTLATMAKMAPAAAMILLALCAQSHAWSLTNVGKTNTLIVELQAGINTSAYAGEVKPGASASCPFNKDGCTSTGGGRCAKNTKLGVRADDGGLADDAQYITGYNGGVFSVSDDNPTAGPFLTYCWIGPCKAPNVNYDGSTGIPKGTQC
ncbi:TPA: hypothetical protein ACH3X1_010938 [Trebouxia sp. C0004]